MHAPNIPCTKSHVHFSLLRSYLNISPGPRISVWTFRNKMHFYEEDLAQPPSWRTTPCRLSTTAYSIYSQLRSVLETVHPSATSWRAIPWWQVPTYHGGYVINFIITTSNRTITTFTFHLMCTLFLPLHSMPIPLLLMLRSRIFPTKLRVLSVRSSTRNICNCPTIEVNRYIKLYDESLCRYTQGNNTRFLLTVRGSSTNQVLAAPEWNVTKLFQAD
jgi:hypothetical protein